MIQRVTVTWAPGQAVVDVMGVGQHGITDQELREAHRFATSLWRSFVPGLPAGDAAEQNGQASELEQAQEAP